MYFCFLTLYARASPIADVFIDARPSAALSDKVLCGANSSMRETMKIVKKTRWRNEEGTYGQGVSNDVSQSIVPEENGNGNSSRWSVEDCSVGNSGSSFYALESVVKSNWWDVWTAFMSIWDIASATTFSLPWTVRHNQGDVFHKVINDLQKQIEHGWVACDLLARRIHGLPSNDESGELKDRFQVTRDQRCYTWILLVVNAWKRMRLASRNH